MEEKTPIEELLADVLANRATSRGSFAALYRRCFGFVRSKGVPQDDARDIVSLTIQKIIESGGLRGARNNAGYLYRMLTNASMDWHRARNRMSRPSTLYDSVDLSVAEEDSESREECLRGALKVFSKEFPDQALVLQLAYMEEWSGSRIATHIGRTPGAARTFLWETRKKFRKLLLEVCNDHFAGMTL
jgi:RNA polymerase sigma factor (sigma-70 family)